MIDIKINKNAETPLYAQIRDALMRAVDQGELAPGDKLPPVTVFAKTIGVTQATVRRALKDLTESGHAISQVGRGTFIQAPGRSAERDEKTGGDKAAGVLEQERPELTLAVRRLRMGIAKSLDTLMDLAKKPGLIHFTAGIPDPQLMEEGMLASLVKDALKSGQDRFQVYGGSPLGMRGLREALAQRFTRAGTPVGPDHILITNGSQQAVSLLAQAALERHQQIICETPCFTGIPSAFGALGHWVESVPRDREGPLPARIQRLNSTAPPLFYLCPELHNPMGTDLSPERQTWLADWAQAHDAELVADEIFHDLRFEGSAPVSLLTQAGEKHAVIIGSLSKSFMVGLRIGWLVTEPDKIRSLVTLKRAMDLGSPPLMQAIAESLLSTGAYDKHLSKARNHYRIRRDAAIEALARYMPDGVTWTVPKGGFHLWVELPEGYSSIALYLLAIERGVAIVPGPHQDIDHRFVHAFRLSYGSVETEKIQKGVRRLADATRALMREPAGEPGLSGLGNFL